MFLAVRWLFIHFASDASDGCWLCRKGKEPLASTQDLSSENMASHVSARAGRRCATAGAIGQVAKRRLISHERGEDAGRFMSLALKRSLGQDTHMNKVSEHATYLLKELHEVRCNAQYHKEKRLQ